MLGCPSHKIQYGTRREASVQLKKHWNGAKGRRVYLCQKCGLWHLGRKH